MIDQHDPQATQLADAIVEMHRKFYTRMTGGRRMDLCNLGDIFDDKFWRAQASA